MLVIYKSIKKLFLMVVLLTCNTLLAQSESIFNKETKETNQTKNQNSTQEKSVNINKLFNAKFPVDDYIIKAGKRKPYDQNISQVFLPPEKREPTKNIIINEDDDKKADTQKLIQEQIDALKAQNELLKNQNNNIVYDNRKITKKMLRDAILADRSKSGIYSYKDNERFGVDGFSNQKSVDISTNEHRLYRMIRAGRMIPALLTTAISSDLSGIVTAQIEEDIRATMGNAVLIPRGSKVIGSYQNNNKIGQDRLQIIWREIITPQGVNILLTDATTSDNIGMSGAQGSVNNKYLERYGIPYALSTLSNVLLLSIANKSKNGTISEEIYQQSSNDVSTILSDILQQQSQLKPTIEIKQGSRIYIVPTYHLWFAKPKNNEVMAKYFID